ncbi:hypothetical protein ABZZ80_02420 [Streptomyces sp. NPDC006356]
MTTSTAERMLARLRKIGVDLPEGTQLVNTFARDWQREQGAWAWKAVGPGDIPLGIGSPFPMYHLLRRKWEVVTDEREGTTIILLAKRRPKPAPVTPASTQGEPRTTRRPRRYVPRPTWVYEGAPVLLLDGSRVIVAEVDEANCQVWWRSSRAKGAKKFPAGFHVLQPAPDKSA